MFFSVPRRVLPPLLFACLTLLVFRSVLFQVYFGDGRTDVVVSSPQSDVINEILPMEAFGFGQMRHGHLPLWNPYVFCGIPFLAGFQAALLYPPNWLHLLLPVTTAINWLEALHVFMAGSTMYLWVRGRGASAAAASIAGVVFMFSAPVFLRVYAGPLSHLNVIVWTPLLLLSIDRLSTTGRWVWVLLGAPAVALQILGGSPQFVYYTGLVTGIYALVLLFRSSFRRHVIAGAIAIFVGGAMLAAVQLFTGAGALGELVRSNGTSYQFASSLPLPPEDLLTTFVPNLFGKLWQDTTAPQLEYFGRSYLWESSMFVGVGGLALAALAAAVRWRQQSPVLVMIGVTVVLALGRHLPVYRVLYDHLPLYGSFRVTSKFVYLTILFICVLTADGFDLLLDRAHRRAVGRAAIVAVGAVVVLLVIAVEVGQPSGVIRSAWTTVLHSILASADNISPPQQRTNPAFELIAAQNVQESTAYAAAAAVCVAVIFFAVRRWPRARFAFLILVTVEMVVFAESSFATTVARRPYPPAWQAAMRDTPGDYRVVCHDLPPGADITYLDWGMINGAQHLWGYDPGVLKRYAETLAVSQGLPAGSASQYLEIHRTPPALLRMLRCRLGFTFAGDDGVVDRYPAPLAVAQLISHYSVLDGRDAVLRRLNAPDFDPARSVILESPPGIAPVEAATEGHVEVIASTTDSLDLKAHTDHPALLLVTNNYSTGWLARPLTPGPQPNYDVLPADHTLTAIPLAAGDHLLRLEYSPLSFRLGRIVTFVSLAIYLAACVALVANNRRRDLNSSRSYLIPGCLRSRSGGDRTAFGTPAG